MTSIIDSINFGNKEHKLIVDIKFNTTTEINERTVEIAEAFGLGIDDGLKFHIYNNFQFAFNNDDITYITGDSGSGKSLLLKSIKKYFNEKKISYTDLNDMEINPEETLITSVGQDTKDAVKILSLVGLNDAFLFLRKFKELSDGQKMRYKIAKLIHENHQFWLIDEFCATMDREMARIISFNIQKICRRLRKGLFVATTHTDLKKDLKPSIYIYKKFNDEIKTEYTLNEINKTCSIFKDIKVEIGSKIEYEKLSKFHYKSSSLGGAKDIYCIYLSGELVGTLVVSMPHLHLKGRNKYFSGKYSATTTENFQQLNREFETIARIIIHPKYRGIGLAYLFLKEYFKLSKSKYIETIAVMPKFNPFFEKAGMIKVDYERYDKKLNERRRRLENLNIDLNLLKSKTYALKIYNQMEEIEKKEFESICKEQLAEYNGAKNDTKNFEDKIELISFCHKLFSYDLEYLIYENPNFKEKIEKKFW